MPTVLHALRTHLLIPDETVAVLEQALAALIELTNVTFRNAH